MTKHCKSCRRDLEIEKYDRGLKTCDECLVKRKKKPTKITLDQCKELAISKGGECLSTEYKNSQAKMLWKCSENHEWETKYNSIKNGSWCPQCARNKSYTIEECKELAISKGGECLSTEYKNNSTKMLWKCSENHEWGTCFAHIKTNGSWCPNCIGLARLTIEQCRGFAISKGGKCLSTVYKNKETKMLWKCSKSHEWEASFGKIKNGRWCPHCAGRAPLTLEECKEFAENKGGECLSTEYKSNSTNMLWRCSENHEWKAKFSNIKNGRWCPQCSSGRSEKMCREIMEKYLLEPFPNTRPDFLEGLELDGYNEELNIAFEYNGKQHYEYIPHFHRNGEEDFETQKERDRKKYRICREKKINLIIIPYQYDYTTPDELDDFIYTELCKIC